MVREVLEDYVTIAELRGRLQEKFGEPRNIETTFHVDGTPAPDEVVKELQELVSMTRKLR